MKANPAEWLPGVDLRLVVGFKKGESLLRRLGYGADELSGDALTILHPNKRTITVCVDKGRFVRRDAQYLSLLAHEASHVVDCWLAGIGEEEAASEERAYMIQSVMLALLEMDEKKRLGKPWKKTKKSA